MGSDESHFNVSLIVRDRVTGQCRHTTAFEERGGLKRSGTDVFPFTNLRCWHTRNYGRMFQEDRSNLMRSNPFFLNVLLPHDTAATNGLKQGERPRTQPCSYTRVTIPRDLRPFLHFSTNGGHSVNRQGAVHPFGIILSPTVFEYLERTGCSR